VLWEYLLPHIHNSFATVLVQSLNQQVGELMTGSWFLNAFSENPRVKYRLRLSVAGLNAYECLLTLFTGAPHHQAPLSCYWRYYGLAWIVTGSSGVGYCVAEVYHTYLAKLPRRCMTIRQERFKKWGHNDYASMGNDACFMTYHTIVCIWQVADSPETRTGVFWERMEVKSADGRVEKVEDGLDDALATWFCFRKPF